MQKTKGNSEGTPGEGKNEVKIEEIRTSSEEKNSTLEDNV